MKKVSELWRELRERAASGGAEELRPELRAQNMAAAEAQDKVNDLAVNTYDALLEYVEAEEAHENGKPPPWPRSHDCDDHHWCGPCVRRLVDMRQELLNTIREALGG